MKALRNGEKKKFKREQLRKEAELSFNMFKTSVCLSLSSTLDLFVHVDMSAHTMFVSLSHSRPFWAIPALYYFGHFMDFFLYNTNLLVY